MITDLAGRIAIVTGGGRGLGRVVAESIAAAHAAVAVVARSEEQLNETVDHIRQRGGEAIAVPTDITDGRAVEKMARQVERDLGHVDILVNNAGVIGPLGPMWETDVEEWQRTVNVNLCGPMFCASAVVPEMIQHHHGHIINVASSAALAAKSYAHSYSISKAALLRFTECLALDTKEYGIKVFAIDPGTVRTAMTEYIMESLEGQTYAPWFRKYMMEGGGVPPELAANLITRLLSGEADSLSGRLIRVSDDIDKLISHSTEIQQDDLYTLRLRNLP